jgi:glycosyltransferase involved in cell wall biosynthesis
MKLIIQIPCFNEQETLPVTINDLPREIDGIDEIEYLVVDDGSTDDTVNVAKRCGVEHVVSLSHNKGLATAFATGLQTSIKLGADIIVNTDADNQYNGQDVVKLVTPILRGESDFVVGERPIMQTEDFSFVKKILQRVGSWVVRLASGTDIQDAPSGFRAISRDAAMELNVFSNFTYTLETIIQAGLKNIRITSVPVRTNRELRPSRLFRSTWDYVKRSTISVIRIFVVYKPFAFFFSIGAVLFSLGFLIGSRFLYFYFTGDASGHVQSLILASIFLGIGTQTILVAFLADVLAVNRKLLEGIKITLNQRDNPLAKEHD